MGFIEVVALPLFTTLVEAVPYAKSQLGAAQTNRDYWMNYQEPGKYHKKWTSASKKALHSLLASGYSTLHPKHPTPYTLHPTPYTLHPTPYILYPTLYTLCPSLKAIRPEPKTQNPKPETRTSNL